MKNEIINHPINTNTIYPTMLNISLTSVPHNTNIGVKQNVQNGNTSKIVVTFSIIEFTLFCLSVITIIILIYLLYFKIRAKPCGLTRKTILLFHYFDKCPYDILATIIKHIYCYFAVAIIAKHISCGLIEYFQFLLFDYVRTDRESF